MRHSVRCKTALNHEGERGPVVVGPVRVGDVGAAGARVRGSESPLGGLPVHSESTKELLP